MSIPPWPPQKPKRCGYDEALMMDEQGNIVEASVANLFVVYRGEVIMPEVGSSMLEGITDARLSIFWKRKGFLYGPTGSTAP